MLDIDTFPSESPVVEEHPVTPGISTVETTDTYGKFHIEPLERGYGITLGNPMRRILLSSIAGAAVTWVKIEGVLHEYSTIPSVKEEVMELLHNVSQVRIRPVTGRPGKMRLEVTGEGMVCAGDIATSADFEIVNPEQHLATLDSQGAKLAVELNVEPGKGYRPAPQGEGPTQDEGLPRGVLPMDAIFNPVRKVNYAVEKTRVGQTTDYERLILEIWTDGSITPSEGLKMASEVLVNHFFLFNSLAKDGEIGPESSHTARMIPAEIYQAPIEKLELSPRTLNSLKRAHLQKVGDIIEMTNEELFRIRNFGVKSLAELNEKLAAMGYHREDGMVKVSTAEDASETTLEVSSEAQEPAETLVEASDEAQGG